MCDSIIFWSPTFYETIRERVVSRCILHFTNQEKSSFKSGNLPYNAFIEFGKELLMEKNSAFEHWIADHLMDGLIIMEPYGYREEEQGNYLHIFRLTLQFDDEPEPFEGVAFIPIPFNSSDEAIPDFTFDGESLDFSEDFLDYD